MSVCCAIKLKILIRELEKEKADIYIYIFDVQNSKKFSNWSNIIVIMNLKKYLRLFDMENLPVTRIQVPVMIERDKKTSFH